MIPVNYKGAERVFEASLQVLGYTHRFHVQVEGTEVLFERDEEGRYRAIVSQETGVKRMDPALLESIALAIEAILA